MPSIAVLTPDQSSEWDRAAERAGLAGATLMALAGRAVAELVANRFSAAASRGVLIACGPGSNGGDGWVAARALHRSGTAVWVASVLGERRPLCEEAARHAIAEGVREVPPDGPWPAVGIAVDALLGTGARGAPRPAVAALLERIVDLRLPIIAVDGPTGVDLGSGVLHGAPQAALSITFGGVRRGHLLARDEVGDIVVVDIGHPPPPPAWPTLLTDADAAALLPGFKAGFHKGNRGRVVIVGGSAGMSGAARMAARAAFAAGAGLVHVAGPAETIAVLDAAEPDVQTIQQPFDREPSESVIALIESAGCVVVGPGLGRAADRMPLVDGVLARAHAVVLDADGLYAYHGRLEQLRRLAESGRVILTPHPGEFRTLFPALAHAAEADPWSAAAAAAAHTGATVLLKGVPSVIASPGGRITTIAAGNPGLATGGSGDLLSGLLGALMAQGLDPLSAAAAGAQALGRAADIAARRHTARAMRPVDVIAALPELWREWELLVRLAIAPRPPVLLELAAPRVV